MKQIDELQAENIQLKQENAELKLLVSSFQAQVSSLQADIARLMVSRNSKTSSTPPSHDVARKNRSLRGKSGKPSGGQKGHKGTTLEMSQHPDKTIEYYPEDTCQNCGAMLTNAILHAVESKQEIVIPPVIFQVVAHQNYACICTHCDTQNKGKLPERLKANIQYHPDVSALVAYFSVWQYLPFGRLKTMFSSVFNLNISEGTLSNMLVDLNRKALIFAYPEIQRRISQADVVGSDETGMKVNGKKQWIWTFQNTKMTLIIAHARRGYAVIEEYFNQGFPHSYYVSDCWAAHLKTPAKAHQICTAHLLRDLNGLIESEPDNCDWSASMKALLLRALSLKKEMNLDAYQVNNPQRERLEYEFSSFLSVDLKSVTGKTHTFLKRMIKHRNSLFTFLYHPAVPPDNNGSERAIRNVKVKSKVSGQFKSDAGAKAFAVLRSVADTAHKNSQNPLQAFSAIANAYC